MGGVAQCLLSRGSFSRFERALQNNLPRAFPLVSIVVCSRDVTHDVTVELGIADGQLIFQLGEDLFVSVPLI